MLKRQIKSNLLSALAVIFALTLVGGCSTVYQRPPVSRKIPKVSGRKHLNKLEIISYLESQPELETFRAKGKINIRTSKWTGSGRVFVVGLYPEKLHFEVYDFFGNPKWIINATDKGVKALNVASRELYVSRKTRDLMESLFAIPADLDEIFFFFTGQKPPVNWSQASLTALHDNRYLLLETTNSLTDDWLLYISSMDLRIDKAVIWHRKDHTKLRIGFKEYNYAGNYLIPFVRTLSVKNAQMQIKYKEFIVDKVLDDNLFRFKGLRKARVIRVGQLRTLDNTWRD